jgi:large subunit ribosomal protein L22
MEVIARSKYIRRAPRKARLVADLVRGQKVDDALNTLRFSPKHAAADVAKAIRSAAANAEHNHSLSRDELFVKTIVVDEGPRTMKRPRPASRGMAYPYVHLTSHITVVVEDRPEEPRERRRPQRRRPEPAAAPPQPVDEFEDQEDEGPRRASPQPVDELDEAGAADTVEEPMEDEGARRASPAPADEEPTKGDK